MAHVKQPRGPRKHHHPAFAAEIARTQSDDKNPVVKILAVHLLQLAFEPRRAEPSLENHAHRSPQTNGSTSGIGISELCNKPLIFQ